MTQLRPRMRRWLQRIAIVVASFVVLLVLVALSLTLPPVRGFLLQRGLRAVSAALPGRLTVEHAHWGGLTSWELERLTWMHGGQSLLRADRLRLQVQGRALWRRDLVVDQLQAERLHADVPLIRLAFDPGAQAHPTPANSEPQAIPFLRSGSLPGLPSVRLRALSLDVPQLVLSTSDTLSALRVRATFDLLADRTPVVDIEHVEGVMASRAITVEPGVLRLDLERGVIEAALTGRLGGAGPFTVTSRDSGANAFALEARFPERGFETHVRGRWERRGARPLALDFEAEVQAPDMRQLGWTELQRWAPARATLAGRLELVGERRVETRLAVYVQQPWFERLDARVRLVGDTLSADSLRVQLDGLELRGAATWSEDELQAQCRALYDGGAWAQALGDSVTLPDSLRLRLELEARGPATQPRVTLQAHGSLRAGSVPIDSLALRVDAPGGWRAPLQVLAAIEAASYRTTLQGSLQLPAGAEPLRAALQPIVVRALDAATPRGSATERSQTEARVVYDVERRRARVEGLRLVGDLGEVAVDGRLDLAHGGRAQIHAQWPEPPHLPVLGDSLAAVLRQAWRADSIPQLEVDVRIAGEAERFALRADGQLQVPHLPLAPVVPATLDVHGWSDLDLRFHAALGDSAFGHIDLGATSWIDTCRVDWSAHGGHRAIDSLRLRLEGIALDARLALVDERLRGRLDMRADDPAMLRRWSGATDSTRISLDAHVELGGTQRSPSVQSWLLARGTHGGWRVPELHARFAALPSRQAEIDLSLPRGLARSNTPFRLDSVRVHYATMHDSLASLTSGRLDLRMEGPDFAWRQSGAVHLRAPVRARVDSLSLRFQDRELRSVRPFDFVQGDDAGSFALEALELRGSLGQLAAHCETQPDTLVLNVDAQLEIPAKPNWLAVPEVVWPSTFQLQAQGSSHEDVRVAAALHGTQLSQQTDLRLEMLLEPAAARGFQARLSLAGADTLVAASALLPLHFEQFPLRAQVLDDSLRIQARWRDIPFALRLPEAGLAAFLDSEDPKPLLSGRLQISGRATDPRLELDGGIALPMLAASDLSLAFQARGSGATRTRADVKAERHGRVIAFGEADVPLRYILAPPTFGLGEGDVSVALRADSLDLAELTPLLPAGTSAEGIFVADLTAQGPGDDPRLQGVLDIAALDLEITGRRSLRLDFKSRLRGSWKAPDVTGTLRIEQARMSIPERQNLLPTSGQPMLWEEASTDSFASELETQPTMQASLRGIPRDARVALNIDVPSGFWILGRDLGVELKGDLDAGVEQQTLVVHGSLEAVQGWFTLMGRQFELDSGRCDFDGLNAFNPTLDIRMRTKVKSTTIFVTLSGDVDEPELTLRSEPEMSEGDIMGMLVFGQTAEQLGSGEGDFLAAQVTALAQSYSGAALQQVLGDQLGVDTVRFKAASEDDGEGTSTSLEVGKYLTPNVLLQYEIDLQTGRGLGVTMEYRISDRLKLDSHLGHERSGVEFNWSRDY